MAACTDGEYSRYKKLINSFRTAFFITIDGQILRSRPMAIAAIEDEDNSIWFFTSDSSHKVDEVNSDSKSAVACMDASTMITVSGNSKIVHDHEKVRRLWNDDYREWFPQGMETPNLALIKFEPIQAEYWDSNNRTDGLKYFVESVKAVASGTPRADESAHGRVIL